MAKINPGRMCAEIDGDFVVFLIGMTINRPWKVHKWLPTFLVMPRLISELVKRSESGYLGSILGFGIIAMYWRTPAHLENYARSADYTHWPEWVKFNKRFGNSRGDVGIWHETYLVRAGDYETIYNEVPLMGLGRAGRLVPASGRRDTFRGRLEDAKKDKPS